MIVKKQDAKSAERLAKIVRLAQKMKRMKC